MSWWQYLNIVREGRDLAVSGRDIERWVCPNDGEPLTLGPNGMWRCRFDGYEPGAAGQLPPP